MELADYRVLELIHQTPRSSVYRGVGPGDAPVVIKTPTSPNPTPRELARYQWAFELAADADERAVVRHIELVRSGASVALVTEDLAGVPLATLVSAPGMPLARWLEMAALLATALGRLHACGLVHKDVNPNNVIVLPAGAGVRLIDLGISMRLRRELVDVPALDQIEGTLAYMSPEQCGRIHSPVDNRSDLYSLGVTLFELATGHLPFAYDSAAELAHAHVARPPAPLRELRPEFPAVVSDMVARLLAKNADNRYASAQGLAHDLHRCIAELRRTGAVRAFQIGQADASSSFRIPDRLYGRQAEHQRLSEAIELACTGSRVVVTVAGVSGIGKTALISDIQRQIAAARGIACVGKFDQFQSAIPYVGILNAMRALLRRELAEPEDRLGQRRAALQEALGIHGQLLTAALPELAAIVGPQPDVEEIPPRDAARRLHLVAGRFLAVFATREQPLLMFLDDLQWADPPSMQLIEAFAADPHLAHMVLIAGYRSNEVGPGHPLREVLQALRDGATECVDIALAPLRQEDVVALLSDTLHADPSAVQSLGAHIHGVSAGNPFFVGEFLHALRERRFFRYDEDRQAWMWDLAQIREHGVPDNVAELITGRLRELPLACLDMLDSASCVGSEFDLRTLASVHEATQSAAAVALAPAVRSGVVVPLDASYKVFQSLDALSVPHEATEALGTARYRFQHDRVRLTVHERLDEDRRAQRHLRIGRLLIQRLPAQELEQRVVDVFTHVVYGLNRLQARDERDRLARLGLAAGVRAQRGLAFDSARNLLQAAASLLSPDAWSEDYDTAMGIHLGLAQCTHALMLGAEFEAASAIVIKRARTAVHASEGHGLRIRVRHTQSRYAEAVDIGIGVAASLGVALPRRPKLPHVLWGVVRALQAQGRRDPRTFAELDEARDPEMRAAVSLLCSSAGAAYFAEPNLLPLIGMTCTRLAIRHGLTPQSPYGFAVWALVLCGVLGRIENGYGYGALALTVGRRYGGVDEARARFVVDCFIKHWKEPLPEVAALLHTDWARNRDSGDGENATYSAGVLLYTHFLAGGSLDAGERYAEPIQYLGSCEQIHVKDCFLAWVELFEALGQRELPGELEGSWFDHARLLPEFERTNNAVQIAISSMAAGILDHFAGRFDRAEQRFATAARWEENIVGQVLVPGLAFFRALNAYRRVAGGLAGKDVLRGARRHRGRLKRWAAFAPFNLDHRVSLLDAEEALCQGRAADGLLLLHKTVEQGSRGALMYQAMAQQRIAEILEAQGARQSARIAALQAAESFTRWGSPALAMRADPLPLPSLHRTNSMGTTGDHKLEGTDLKSLFDAVAVISSEIDESALLGRLMPALMQASGADRGLLLLLDTQRQLWVEAEASLGETSSQRTPLAAFTALSRRAVDLAFRSAAPVVVQDAANSPLLDGESHAKTQGVASLFAMAIALQGRTIGVLYLENHVARSAFTASRVEVTRALGAQAGIALENARLYGRIQAALDTQTALADANQRFVPRELLSGLGFNSIVDVKLSEAIEREMNVLFVDLRGFTALSLALGPSRTIAMINRYLSHVQPGIAAHGGFVGQYYGDGVLALFPNDAEDALRGAIAMCRGLEGYNRERGSDFPELHFGMGLHRGTLTLGTIGDPDHFQCGVVGDSVNLASRIEGLTKHFGTTLVVSSATLERVRAPEQFGLRPLGRVEVAGRPQGLEVFECVASLPESIQPQILAAGEIYLQGLAAYRAGRWSDALPMFEACERACEQDAVARAFAARCRARLGTAFPWEGIERPAKG